jgi:hypothetical protein
MKPAPSRKIQAQTADAEMLKFVCAKR